jgi:hypothetical protein
MWLTASRDSDVLVGEQRRKKDLFLSGKNDTVMHVERPGFGAYPIPGLSRAKEGPIHPESDSYPRTQDEIMKLILPADDPCCFPPLFPSSLSSFSCLLSHFPFTFSRSDANCLMRCIPARCVCPMIDGSHILALTVALGSDLISAASEPADRSGFSGCRSPEETCTTSSALLSELRGTQQQPVIC